MPTISERYEAAAHRVQTAIAFRFGRNYRWMEQRLMDALKHLRVGIDMSKADQAGLATLLITKGVITRLEYEEAMLASAEREAEYQQQLLTEQMREDNPDVHIHTV